MRMVRNVLKQQIATPPREKGGARDKRSEIVLKSIIWCLFLMLIIITSACGTSPQVGSDDRTGSTQPTEVITSQGGATVSDRADSSLTEPTSEVSLTSVPSQDVQISGQPVLEPSVITSPENSYFEIHYIDVGQADAALVLCDDDAMLIDGGNVADSSLIYAYLKEHEVSHLDYVICTHAHEDHVGGLAGALNYATVSMAYCPVVEYDTEAFNNFIKYLNKQNVLITVPAVGDTFLIGSAKVTVIGPVKQSNDTNNTSIVLRIEYGNTSFLFTGDAEREEEQDILDAGCTLSSTVLKVGHHGSANSTTYPFLREIMPEYAIISVGSNNSYGHPAEDTLSRLRDAGVTVYRTDMQGHIVCKSDGENVDFYVSKNAGVDTLGLPPNSADNTDDGAGSGITGGGEDDANLKEIGNGNAPTGTDFVLNTNTNKFHYPSCSSVNSIKESNKSYYNGARDEVISMGYLPCGRCHP